MAVLREKGKVKRKGILMDKAQGIPLMDLIEKKKANPNLKVTITPEAQRDLVNLQVLDSLCGQVDRNTSNYFVNIDEDSDELKILSVQGIDNDMSFGNLTFSKLRMIARLPRFFKDSNMAVIPFMDKGIAETLLNLTPQMLEFIFNDLLTQSELDALNTRLKQIQDTIRLTVTNNDKFLIDKSDWNDNTLKELEKEDGYLQDLRGFLKALDEDIH